MPTPKQEGGKTCTGSTHVKAPGQNKDGIQQNIKNAAGHGANAGMQRSTLAADHGALHNVQDSRYRTAGHSPEEILRCSLQGSGIGSQQLQQRCFQNRARQRQNHCTAQGTVKSKHRAGPHPLIIPLTQAPAHHTGSTDAKQVGHRIKCQDHRIYQGHRRILHRIIQHSHKKSIRQIIGNGHKTGDDHGHRQAGHCPGYGHGLKQIHGRCFLFHISLPFLMVHYIPAGKCSQVTVKTFPFLDFGWKL